MMMDWTSLPGGPKVCLLGANLQLQHGTKVLTDDRIDPFLEGRHGGEEVILSH